jgi:hypothetical protein
MTVAPANEVRFAAGPWSPSGQPSRHSVDTGGQGRRTPSLMGPSEGRPHQRWAAGAGIAERHKTRTVRRL